MSAEAAEPSHATIASALDVLGDLDAAYVASEPRISRIRADYLSSRAITKFEARVEGALAASLAREGLCSPEDGAAIGVAAATVTAEDVAAEEASTRHATRALVNVIRSRVEMGARPFVHLGATSSDIVDTANALRYRECIEIGLTPLLASVASHCRDLAQAGSDHPLPSQTRQGEARDLAPSLFSAAEYVDRLDSCLERLRAASSALRGKMSGAVGSYNSFSLLLDDPRAFERRALQSLGLRPGSHSTQIVAPEQWTDLAHALVIALGVLADAAIALMRPRAGNIVVRESTQASAAEIFRLWRVFMPRVVTTYMDQISEHQRDLTNSASQRFLGELVTAAASAAVLLDIELRGLSLASATSGVSQVQDRLSETAGTPRRRQVAL